METNDEIIYNWNCNTIDKYPTLGELTDVIHRVHWIVTGWVDYGTQPIVARCSGIQDLNTDNVQNFIPFNEITSTNTTLWVKTAMGTERITSIESDIMMQIDLLKNPVSVTAVVPDAPIDQVQDPQI
jgi:hypothetical protein